MSDNTNFTFDYCGKSITLYLPMQEDHIQKQILNSKNFYEIDLLEEIGRLPLKDGIICDIGANIGNHSVYFSSILKRDVFAFEPNKIARDILDKNIELNDLRNKVKVFQVGLGSEETQGSMDINTSNLGASRLNLVPNGDVAIKTLDSYITKNINVSLLKIDVEGFEIEVLEGAKETIKNNKPLIVIETQTHRDFLNINEKLYNLEYMPFGQKGATNTVFFIHKENQLSNEIYTYLQRIDNQIYNNANLKRYREIVQTQNKNTAELKEIIETKDKNEILLKSLQEILGEVQKDKTSNNIKHLENQVLKLSDIKEKELFDLRKEIHNLYSNIYEKNLLIATLKAVFSHEQKHLKDHEKAFTIIKNYIHKLEIRNQKLEKKLGVLYSSKTWKISSRIRRMIGEKVQSFEQYIEKINSSDGKVEPYRVDAFKWFPLVEENHKELIKTQEKIASEVSKISIENIIQKNNFIEKNYPNSIQLLVDYKSYYLKGLKDEYRNDTSFKLLQNVSNDEYLSYFELLYDLFLSLDVTKPLSTSFFDRTQSNKEFAVQSFRIAPKMLKLALFSEVNMSLIQSYIKTLVIFKSDTELLNIFEEMIVELYTIFKESELLALLELKNIDKETLLNRTKVIEYFTIQPIGFIEIVDESFYGYLESTKNMYSSVLGLFFYNILIKKQLILDHILLFFTIKNIKFKNRFLNSIRRFTSLIKEAKTDFVNYQSVVNYVTCDQDLIYLSMFDSSKVKDSITGVVLDTKIVFSDETIAFVKSQFNDNSKLSSIVNEALNKAKLYSNINFKTESFRDLANSIANITDSAESFSEDMILVILATYNPDIDLLKISIDSILNQTHKRFILAVVDDCSTNSKNISDLVDSYSDEKLHYFKMEQNSGPYKCRNYVIQKFDFDFVTFQDDDDVSHPQRLEYELSQLHNSDAKIVACSNIRFTGDSHVQIDNDGSFFSYGPVTMMIPREVFESIGLFKEYKSRGDVEFRKRVFKHFGEDAYLQLETPLYFSLGGHLTLSSSFEYGKDYSKLSLIRQIMLKDETKNIKSLKTKIKTFSKVFNKKEVIASLEITENPKVSVIMTSYNTADYIEKAIHSILNQTYSNLELIVVDDCSTDFTRDIVLKMATTDDRLKLYCFGENRGTYFAKNFGITKSSGDIITFMDSDDTSDLKRIQTQLNHLDKYIGCVCKYERRDLKGNIVTSNGIRARVALISLMFRKETLKQIGYFDTVRTSADDEFRERIRTVYGQDSIKTIPEILYHAILRDESLTNEKGNAINLTPNRENGESFLPPSRANYLKDFQSWHEYCSVNNNVPYIPFPVRCRPFSATGKLVVANGIYDNNSVSVCLASFPPREKKLKKVVECFLSQADNIYVYLNDYKEIPAFLDHPRIHVKLSNDAYGDLRDNGKMYFMNTVPNGYCFTVDDDINYPDDYIEKMIRKIEIYERKAIVGIHGTIFAKPFENYFKNRTVFHFKNKLERDVVVNQLGTGTVGFHTSLIRPNLEEFCDVGMADVFMAIIAKKNAISLICIDRDENWMSAMEEDEGGNLYHEFRKNDSKQTKYISQILPFEEIISGELGLSLKNKIEKYGDVFAKEIVERQSVVVV